MYTHLLSKIKAARTIEDVFTIVAGTNSSKLVREANMKALSLAKRDGYAVKLVPASHFKKVLGPGPMLGKCFEIASEQAPAFFNLHSTVKGYVIGKLDSGRTLEIAFLYV